MTHKLLTFSRHDASRIEVFDAGQVLADMQPTLHQLFDPAVRLLFNPDKAQMPVRVDRAQFELVVLNIAANANQAMPHGGQFTLALREVPDSADVEISLRDSGNGMSFEGQQRIFEPFFTTKPAAQGTGIGLAVAAGVIGEAGGSLTADSAVGSGAVFRIRLPLASCADDAMPETATAVPPAATPTDNNCNAATPTRNWRAHSGGRANPWQSSGSGFAALADRSRSP